jgi:hypothetical protein
MPDPPVNKKTNVWNKTDRCPIRDEQHILSLYLVDLQDLLQLLVHPRVKGSAQYLHSSGAQVPTRVTPPGAMA